MKEKSFVMSCNALHDANKAVDCLIAFSFIELYHLQTIDNLPEAFSKGPEEDTVPKLQGGEEDSLIEDPESPFRNQEVWFNMPHPIPAYHII